VDQAIENDGTAVWLVDMDIAPVIATMTVRLGQVDERSPCAVGGV
jgi:hypothetical protein